MMLSKFEYSNFLQFLGIKFESNHSIDKIDPDILFELQKERLATVWTETFTRKEITLKNYIPKIVRGKD